MLENKNSNISICLERVFWLIIQNLLGNFKNIISNIIFDYTMLFLLGGPYNVIFSIFYLLGDNKISIVYNWLKFHCYLYICLEIIFYSSYWIKVLYLSLNFSKLIWLWIGLKWVQLIYIYIMVGSPAVMWFIEWNMKGLVKG